MRSAHAGWLVGTIAFIAIALLVRAQADSTATGSDGSILAILAELGLLALPVGLAAGILAARMATVARGPDLAARLLALATAGLPGPRSAWGAAMRAELASLDHTAERRRFAVSAGWAAVRAGSGSGAAVTAIVVGIAAAGVTLGSARLMFEGERTGLLGQTLLVPPLVLFGVAALGARRAGRFRAGLEVGGLSLIAMGMGIFTVAMVEAVWWFDAYGIYVMDGDAPRSTIGLMDAVLDPISPTFLALHLLFWAPYPVLGAAVGAGLRRRSRTPSIDPGASRRVA